MTNIHYYALKKADIEYLNWLIKSFDRKKILKIIDLAESLDD